MSWGVALATPHPHGRALSVGEGADEQPLEDRSERVDQVGRCHGRERLDLDGIEVSPQSGGFYGGWITPDIVGPFKGEPGTRGW